MVFLALYEVSTILVASRFDIFCCHVIHEVLLFAITAFVLVLICCKLSVVKTVFGQNACVDFLSIYYFLGFLLFNFRIVILAVNLASV